MELSPLKMLLLRVYLGSTYFVEIENFFVESTIDNGKS